MSFELPSSRKVRFSQPSWGGVAFLVEAMLLLVVLIASLAVFTQLFGAAVDRGERSEQLSQAVAAVSSATEEFIANPSQAGGVWRQGDLVVSCQVEGEERAGGTLWHATVSAYPASTDGVGSSQIELARQDDVNITEEDLASGAPQALHEHAEAQVPEGVQPLYTVTTSRYESEVAR